MTSLDQTVEKKFARSNGRLTAKLDELHQSTNSNEAKVIALPRERVTHARFTMTVTTGSS